MLGQDPDGELTCIYCGKPAETWDHIHGLVRKAEFSGYGHQLGNLVPCCKGCNSRKGSKEWEAYLEELEKEILENSALDERRKLISSYLDRYDCYVNPKRAAEMFSKDWKRYCEIKIEIINLMSEADGIAKKLREDE